MTGFSTEQWTRIKDVYGAWWNHDLDRPLLFITAPCDPGRPEPGIPPITREVIYDPAFTPEQIVDRWEYDLACTEHLGDAFPAVWPDFGPGVLATALGADAEPATGTVWFHPREELEIPDVHLEYDPDSPVFKRLKDICRCAIDRWEGRVQISMTDLGGNLDLLSTFRPSEKLLLDLYDHPDDVKRVTWEAHEAWFQAWEDINAILQPVNPGHTAWTPIFSETPYYMLQCDFCYMIGPDMFDEFVKPELAAACKRLDHAFYHLDGPGQLPHLDSLLAIKELNGVQWVPGAGNPGQPEWPEVYRKIRDASKLIQVHDAPGFDRIVEPLDSARSVILISRQKHYEQALELLRKYGAE